MQLSNELINDLQHMIEKASRERLSRDDLKTVCEHLGISKLYYDVDFEDDFRFRDNRVGKVVADEEIEGNKIMLYKDGQQTGLCLKYAYFFDDKEYVHSYQEFKIGVKKEDLDLEALKLFADLLYLLMSRRNMRKMLDISQNSDALTGIPNVVFLQKKYKELTRTIPEEDLLLIRLNLQNFRYVNDVAGGRAGDEAIIQYSRKLCTFVADDEAVCRLGGDNYVLVIRKKNLEAVQRKLGSVLISNLKSAPGVTFNISTWMGISEAVKGRRRPFFERLNEASAACELAKGKLKKPVVYFDDELVEAISKSRKILSMFRPAIQKREFVPFFQAKVDMRNGELVGFEALCRWIHEGHFIYPDQFIPVLDKNSLIPELHITIIKATCSAIRQWKNMGYDVPVISSNFSKKNLYVMDIDERIADIIDDFGLSPDCLEIEITESVKDTEYEQLMDFIRKLKNKGIRISIDDFGTGYSSLSLIHNINADVIKIDRSFVDKLPDDRRSRILIESIINIADRLHMSVIAEGVENEKQGRALLEMGCNKAQGYYYSKPVDFEAATKLLESTAFRPMSE